MPRGPAGDAGAGADRKAPGAGAARPGGRGRDHGGPRLTGAPLSHAARLTPLRPETVWTLVDGELVERVGGRERRWRLEDLRSFRIVGGGPGSPHRAVDLTFLKGRCRIVSWSLQGPGRLEDRTGEFARLTRAIAEEAADRAPAARFTGGVVHADPFIWTAGLLGIGAAVLLAASLTAGAATLGIALAARLIFLLILVLAALPWLRRDAPGLDPRALPGDLLPRD